jgi:hypothetical protein
MLRAIRVSISVFTKQQCSGTGLNAVYDRVSSTGVGDQFAGIFIE